jgi:hypothetical protein
MNKSSGVSYLNTSDSQTTTQDNSNQKAISKIRHEASRDLNEMLQSMFDGIDDSFFELANNARTNNEQNRFFEAMREIRIKRKSIEADFDNAISLLFSSNFVLKKNNVEASPENDANFDSLSLVQNEDLEEDVAISTMSTKARSNFQGLLLQFHARIGKLYGIPDLSESSPPLDPKDISQAFSKACLNTEIQIKEKLIVYKQFDRYVLSNLGSVLESANKNLIRLGIMPSLKTPGIRQKHTPKSENSSTPIIKNTVPTSQNAAQSYSNTLPHLQSLLANIRIRTSSNHSTINDQVDTNTTQMVSTQDLISMLTELQKIPPTTQQGEHSSVINIHTALQRSLHQNTSKDTKKPSFTQIDEDLINLVSMLFEFILEDYNLAPPIQVLISRLQIPILKVVIKDNSFFNSRGHPARHLLNSLAKAGIGWGEPKNNNRDPLFDKIHETVHKVLNEFTGDIALFEQLNIEFQKFIIKDERRSKIVEQRTKEAEMGQIKSRQAQRSVEESINQFILTTSRPIPEFIIDILKIGWSRVIFLAFLKDEKEHQWVNVNKVAEDLIWCLQPLKSQKERQRWITIAPKLLKDLRSGLEDVSYKTTELDSTIITIRTELTSAFKNSSFNGAEESNNKTHLPINLNKKTSSTDKSAVSKQLESKDTKLIECFTEIDNMEIGTWLEFTLMNGGKYRCKLSAKLPEANCFIFVNRVGLKTIEKTKEELANDLNKKNVIILEQGLMIDRAMNAVTSTLRQKASA